METTVRQRVRVDEFAAISEGDPRPMELIDGEVVVMSHPRRRHALLQARLISELVGWGEQVPGRPQSYGSTSSSSPSTTTTGPMSSSPARARGWTTAATSPSPP